MTRLATPKNSLLLESTATVVSKPTPRSPLSVMKRINLRELISLLRFHDVVEEDILKEKQKLGEIEKTVSLTQVRRARNVK